MQYDGWHKLNAQWWMAIKKSNETILNMQSNLTKCKKYDLNARTCTSVKTECVKTL